MRRASPPRSPPRSTAGCSSRANAADRTPATRGPAAAPSGRHPTGRAIEPSGPRTRWWSASTACASSPDPRRASHWTVDVAGCAAVLAWDDGRRVLIGHDATHLDVAPWRFEHGRELVDAIDTTMPAALRVAMGAGEGPPAPAATGHRRRRICGALALATTAGVAFALGRLARIEPRRPRPTSASNGGPSWRTSARRGSRPRRWAEQMIEDGDVTGGGSLRFTDCPLRPAHGARRGGVPAAAPTATTAPPTRCRRSSVGSGRSP